MEQQVQPTVDPDEKPGCGPIVGLLIGLALMAYAAYVFITA
jgi:hypothetical protein